MTAIQDRSASAVLGDEIPTCEPCHRAMMGDHDPADMNCPACVARVLHGYNMRAAAKVHRVEPQAVDFSLIPDRQQAMHARLVDWGRSCNGGASDETAPMFRQFQSNNAAAGGYARDINVPVDRSDASRLGRSIYGLPEPHRLSLHWYYVKRTSVMQGRRSLACTAAALAQYVIDARTMLINRGV